jgi:hypothetical protein
VTNLAFSLAVHMDADPVILMGQDLAFSGNKMYCRHAVDGGQEVEFANDGASVSMRNFTSKLRLADDGSRREMEKRLSKAQRVVRVKGLNGEMLPSTDGFRAMLTWFERAAEDLAGSRRVVNATEGGAFIRGMEHMPFAQVVRELAPGDPVNLDERIPPPAPASSRSKVFGGLRRMATEFGKVERIAHRCDKRAEQALGALEDHEVLTALQRLDKKLCKLVGKHLAVDALVQDALRQYRALGDPSDDDLAANLTRSRLLYQATAEAGRTLKEALHGAIEKGASP